MYTKSGLFAGALAIALMLPMTAWAAASTGQTGSGQPHSGQPHSAGPDARIPSFLSRRHDRPHSGQPHQGSQAPPLALPTHVTPVADAAAGSTSRPGVPNDDLSRGNRSRGDTLGRGTIRQLTLYRDQEALLQARIKIAELESKLGSASAGNSGATKLGLPRVKMIYGRPNRLSAFLVYRNRSTVNVRVGSRLPDGGRVVRIAPDGVSIRINGTVVPLLIEGGARQTLTFPVVGQARAYSFTPPALPHPGNNAPAHPHS